MSIYKSIEFTIYCDNCPAFVDFQQFETLADAKKSWRNVGWSIGKKNICPDCKMPNKACRRNWLRRGANKYQA